MNSFNFLLNDVLSESEYADEIETNLTPEDTSDIADIDDTLDIDDADNEIDARTRNTARLLSIDRIKINQELKELTKKELKEFPISTINEILNKYGIALCNSRITIDGTDGDEDFELMYNERIITNSAMVLYYHKIDNSDMFNYNCYLL